MARPPLPLESWGKIRRTTHGGAPAAVAYYRDSDGTRRKMLRTGTTPAAAERNLVAALRQRIGVNAEDEILTADSTLRTLARQWYTEKKDGNLKSGSLHRYSQAIETHIIPGIGDLRLHEATVPRMDRYLRALRDTSGRGTGATVRVVLKGMFALAVRHGALRSNPIPDTSTGAVKRARPVAPDVAQIVGVRSRFLEWDHTPDKRGHPRVARLMDTVDLLIGTGMRTGEVLALKWDAVDLIAATVTVSRTVALTEGGSEFVQDMPKTDDSYRVLHLPPHVVQVLARRDQSTEFVFPSSVGTFWRPSNYRRTWREALRGTEYQGMTPKALRKLVATALDRALGARAAGNQLGHASIETTRAHYIAPSRLGPETAALDKFFSVQVAESSH